ncbi:MAG TPA: histidine phosphatase family protein [Acetobacteraceae bacterium]|nr:histidine phosphatase family protein [Acetobacteraceae bacterium]
MSPTRFWLVRHAPVDDAARAILYGTMDVALCPASLEAAAPLCQALARKLPRPAEWIVSPLTRTHLTAEAIFAAGYPEVAPVIEPDVIEQSLGQWQGLAHAALPERLKDPAHAFWPLGPAERPPGGESVADMIGRVGAAFERLAARHPGADVVVIGHGGAIRAAVAHALGIGGEAALSLAVQNLSLTRLERHPHAWRVVCINEMAAHPAGGDS